MRGGRIEIPLKAGQHRSASDDGSTLNAGFVALRISGDPDQYCYETLYFCDFFLGVGVRTPCLPFWISACFKTLLDSLECFFYSDTV